MKPMLDKEKFAKLALKTLKELFKLKLNASKVFEVKRRKFKIWRYR